MLLIKKKCIFEVFDIICIEKGVKKDCFNVIMNLILVIIIIIIMIMIMMVLII